MPPKLDPATLEWCAEYMTQLEYYQKASDIGGQSAAERVASGSRMLMAQEVAQTFRSKIKTEPFSAWSARVRYSPEVAEGVGIVAAVLLQFLVDYANVNDVPADGWFTIPSGELAHSLGVSARRLTEAAAALGKRNMLELRYEGPNWRRHFRVASAPRTVLR